MSTKYVLMKRAVLHSYCMTEKKKVMVLQEAQLVPQPLESQEVQDLPETGWLRIIFLV